MQEQHCKHTQEMLFLADTYNTYLGDIWLEKNKSNLWNFSDTNVQGLRGSGGMFSKNTMQLEREVCRALHIGWVLKG